MLFDLEDLFPKGKSGIKIKPENKGKFTASANRAGMSVQEYASHILNDRDHYNSSEIKRAVFAKNSAKWNKGQGGLNIPPDQLPYFRPRYREGELIPDIDYPIGANIDQNDYQKLKPYTKTYDDSPQPYTSVYMADVEKPEINTDLALEGRLNQSPQKGRKRGLGFDGGQFSQLILGGLGAINSLLPERGKKFQAIQPQMTYNPYASGTGSQAIMESGGIIPTDRDNFFPYEFGGDPIIGQQKVSSDRGKNKANVAEILSYFAAKGANPLGTKGGSFLRTQALTAFDEETANQLFDSMITFSARPDVSSMSPEQRINTFYELAAKNQKINPAISELRNINYSPIVGIGKSPDPVIANLTDEYLQPNEATQMAKKKSGGKLKKKIIMKGEIQ